MAEALVAVGLAANIAQFVGYGISIISETREICHSAHGAKQENLELEHVISDIQNLNNQIDAGVSTCAGKALSPDELALQTLAKDCQPLSDELLSILRKLKPRGDGRFPKLEAFRKALRSAAKKRDIENLEARLYKIENQVSLRFMAIFRKDQSRILEALKVLNENTLVLNSSLKQQYEDLSSQIELHVKSQPYLISTSLSTVMNERKKIEAEQRILDRLAFDTMQKRYSDVKDAHGETFHWVHDNEATRFLEWLETGGGIYWVTGKPGSGKSTLMKHICDHNKTHDALKGWAGSNGLVTASYFFWSVGSPLQKSHEGLLRSLLHQVLTARPELITQSCTQINSNLQWTVQSLQKSLDTALEQALQDTNFCFFIDGLDEYEGDTMDIVDYMQQLATVPNFKLCVSSRPWSAFQIAFGGSCFQLSVETLTRDDLQVYVHDALNEDVHFRRIAEDEPRCKEFTSRIVRKADGVFLWVYLVVRNLLKDIRNGEESFDDLQQRLDTFPSELNEYFRRILDNLDPLHREETARIFLVLLEQRLEDILMPLQAFEGLKTDMKTPGYPLFQDLEPLSQDEFYNLSRKWQTRLNNRCRDLLDIPALPDIEDDDIYRLKVDFVHKTVLDFLRENYTTELQASVTPDFDPLVCRCYCKLYYFKISPARDIETVKWDAMDFLLHLFFVKNNNALVVQLIEELDRVMSTYTSDQSHWTFSLDPISAMRDPGVLRHEPSENLLLFLVATIGITCYVDYKIGTPSNPIIDSLQTRLLAYTYCYPYLHPWIVEVSMVKLLLEKGANPNERVGLLNGCTAWAGGLLYCFIRRRIYSDSEHDSMKEDMYNIAMLLIDYGADPDVRFDEAREFYKNVDFYRDAQERKILESHIPETLPEMLSAIFNPAQVQQLQAKIDEVTIRKFADANASAQESLTFYSQVQQALVRASNPLIGLASRISGLSIGQSSSQDP